MQQPTIISISSVSPPPENVTATDGNMCCSPGGGAACCRTICAKRSPLTQARPPMRSVCKVSAPKFWYCSTRHLRSCQRAKSPKVARYIYMQKQMKAAQPVLPQHGVKLLSCQALFFLSRACQQTRKSLPFRESCIPGLSSTALSNAARSYWSMPLCVLRDLSRTGVHVKTTERPHASFRPAR